MTDRDGRKLKAGDWVEVALGRQFMRGVVVRECEDGKVHVDFNPGAYAGMACTARPSQIERLRRRPR